MMSDNFDQISVGDRAELEHCITAADVQTFADLTGDDNPLHMDDTFANTVGFGKRVVHGMLSASFFSTLIGTKLPGKGALWYEQNLRFLRPVRLGETIRVQAEVVHKSLSQRVLTLKTVVLGEGGERVVDGEGKVKVLKPVSQGKERMDKERKAVLVTGASRGIGAAIAQALALSGHPVLLNCATTVADAQAVADEINRSGGKAMVWQADVCDPEAVAAMVKAAQAEWGALAGAVHNASAALIPTPLAELRWEQMQRHLDVQLKGAFNLFGSMVPVLEAEGGGMLVTIGSVLTDNVPAPHLAHYVAAKSALSAFTKSIAADYGPKGIRANTVSPGMTQTAMIADFPEKAKMVTKMQTPLRRLGVPDDISGLVTFLFGPGALYITGQNFRVCGGIVMA
ncbi:MAG: SDR family oxidoreductase [Magnetococcales bacterium]|nr:SDR family oxidoreductase [Magnetococcales bacterium]